MSDYNVCGVLVMVAPSSAAIVEQTLNGMEGVEVHANHNSRLVVTVEGPNNRDFANRINSFADIKGVLSTSLVYHEIETEAVSQEASNDSVPPAQELVQ